MLVQDNSGRVPAVEVVAVEDKVVVVEDKVVVVEDKPLVVEHKAVAAEDKAAAFDPAGDKLQEEGLRHLYNS